jgi:hypothetical protein
MRQPRSFGRLYASAVAGVAAVCGLICIVAVSLLHRDASPTAELQVCGARQTNAASGRIDVMSCSLSPMGFLLPLCIFYPP